MEPEAEDGMTGYIERMYPGLNDYMGRIKNFGKSYLFSFSSGMAFRMLVNDLLNANSGMTKNGIPPDELVGPVVYYALIFGADKLGRYMGWVDDSSAVKKYAPHAVAAFLTCGGWEGAQYLSWLDSVNGLQQSFLGTVKDVIMRLVSIGTYRSDDSDRSIVERIGEKISYLLTETRK
jgi:hypothetical protein